MPPPRIILASASPRRQELLTRIGIAHTVHPAHVDESVRTGEAAAPYTERLAREKADAIAKAYPDATVIAADTTVVVDGAILGKPADAAEAATMLRTLSGREHSVVTAVAVVRGTKVSAAIDEATVTFRFLTDADIAAYVDTGEPLDKAGAYGIQGFGATLITGIHGDFYAVMGLGLATTVRLLVSVGYIYRFGDGLDED